MPDSNDPQSFNRFSYVQNAPLVYTDPSGHCRRPGQCLTVGGQAGFSPDPATLQVAEAYMPGFASKHTKIDWYDGPMETGVGILCEPCDWVIAVSDGLQWHDGLSLLPLLPATIGNAVGRAASRIIPAGWSDDAGQAIGHWVSRAVGNSQWERYQALVTGVSGAEFMFNGVRFDGVRGVFDSNGDIANVVLLDAKRWTMGFLTKLKNNQSVYNSKLADARRQVQAAGSSGVRIEWHFHDKRVADWWAERMRLEGIDGIDVRWTQE